MDSTVSRETNNDSDETSPQHSTIFTDSKSFLDHRSREHAAVAQILHNLSHACNVRHLQKPRSFEVESVESESCGTGKRSHADMTISLETNAGNKVLESKLQRSDVYEGEHSTNLNHKKVLSHSNRNERSERIPTAVDESDRFACLLEKSVLHSIEENALIDFYPSQRLNIHAATVPWYSTGNTFPLTKPILFSQEHQRPPQEDVYTTARKALNGGKYCRMESCMESANTRSPYCTFHAGSRRCEFRSCHKCAQGRTRFCIAHGGGRRCTFPNCTKAARDKFFCAAHGGGRRCKEAGCMKLAVGNCGKCTGHGGGKRCQRGMCKKSAQSGTNFCVRHGGGRTCQIDGCTKAARGKTLRCMAHGGVDSVSDARNR